MNGFPVFLGFVFLFSVVSATSCPAGTPTKCSCTNVAGNFKVKCVNEDGINEMQSWLPINTTYLEFDACNIRTLVKENFTKLVDFRRLKINNRKIPLTFSHGLVFQGLKNLTRLNFDGCKINSLPRGFLLTCQVCKSTSSNIGTDRAFFLRLREVARDCARLREVA
jgi:hypothetical protein